MSRRRFRAGPAARPCAPGESGELEEADTEPELEPDANATEVATAAAATMAAAPAITAQCRWIRMRPAPARPPRQMFPSPSLGPPLLSESWSPPPFCGMPPADFCFEVVPEDEDEDEDDELLDGWLAGALEEPPPQAVTSAMT